MKIAVYQWYVMSDYAEAMLGDEKLFINLLQQHI
jgi:hypothetical protein